MVAWTNSVTLRTNLFLYIAQFIFFQVIDISMVMGFFFLYRSPDSAKVKQKMVYASTKDAVKKKIGTIAGVQLQATDKDELEQSCMEEAAKKFDRA